MQAKNVALAVKERLHSIIDIAVVSQVDLTGKERALLHYHIDDIFSLIEVSFFYTTDDKIKNCNNKRDANYNIKRDRP